MKQNYEDWDKHIRNLIRESAQDMPSEAFTKRVMQSVSLSSGKKSIPDKYRDYWYLIVIPLVLFTGGAAVILSGTEILGGIPIRISLIIDKLLTAISLFLQNIKTVSISPVVIMIFFAISTLLLIEIILDRKRKYHFE